MAELACLNGRIMPISEAKIPIEDRGLQFGDSIYEVIRAYSGHLWLLDRHMERLKASILALNITGVNLNEVESQIKMTLQRSGIGDAIVYLQITRGVAPRSHAIPQNITPNIIITVRHIQKFPEELYATGVKAVLVEETRWARRDIKATNLLPNILAYNEARRRGAFEAIFVDQADGMVTEGSHTNVFAVINGVLRTPPADHRILPGVTREFVLWLASKEGIEVDVSPLPVSELMEAEEIFLTGTLTEILGVTLLENKIVGTGTVGTITKRLHSAFREEVRKAIESAA
ncbi:MAG: aminotransferase class IV [Armatimonadota bacterium]|nr:aminotransferase class IV [Armatimonadota bacterium]MCX7778270.1 aminotransferase class IV [Armatimonadota bacterium]MDW8026299.1 aminotransferase class IV [Armatimonadota bacterium]